MPYENASIIYDSTQFEIEQTKEESIRRNIPTHASTNDALASTIDAPG